MKKLILFSCLFLSACSSDKFPFCHQYSYLNKNNEVKTSLYIQKNGQIEKEIKTPRKTFSQKGLYTVQNEILSLYIKNQKEDYLIKENADTLVDLKTNRPLKCD